MSPVSGSEAALQDTTAGVVFYSQMSIEMITMDSIKSLNFMSTQIKALQPISVPKMLLPEQEINFVI